MGRRNQRRRARQQRRQEHEQRTQQRRRPAPSAASACSGDPTAGSGDESDLDVRLQQLILSTARLGAHPDDRPGFDAGVTALTQLERDRPGEVTRSIGEMMLRLVGNLFEGGWQPADLAHLVKRARTARAHRSIVATVAAHARAHDAPSRAPHAWLAQLGDLGAYDSVRASVVGGHPDSLGRWIRTEKLHPDEAISISLLTIATLVDPPSQWPASNRGAPRPRTEPRGSGGETKALTLIRALLAKAEATSFEAEAEAFTAKAQELMTRHSIDAAVLASASRGAGADAGIESRRIHIDDPYADEKATFLSIIADVNGARAVWSPDAGFVTVMGFAVDLQLTDVLFTSLLVQATHASAESTAADRRSRTPSYRRAFLLSYANRIGERLEATRRHASTVAAEEYGDSLLPILADRRSMVDAAYEEAFPNSQPMKRRSLDAAGYHAGRAAADRASIGVGRPIERAT